LASDRFAPGLFTAFNATQAYFLYRELQRELGYKFDLTTVVIGLTINLAIILASPYAHYFMGGSGRYEAEMHDE